MNRSVTVYFGAHIDDVFLGAFSHLAQNEGDKKILVCTTDNIPSPKDYPKAYQYVSPSSYRAQLDQEIDALCAMTNIDQYIELTIPDGKTLLHIDKLSHEIKTLLSEHDPSRIVFPTYEGGHIDHEILSVVLGIGQRFMRDMLEYALYHKEGADTYVHNTFLNGESQLHLSQPVLQKKREALALLHTKQADISYFLHPELESVRPYQRPNLTEKPTPYLLYEHSQHTTHRELIAALQAANII